MAESRALILQQNLKKSLLSDKTVSTFKKILPRMITPEMFLQAAMNSAVKNPAIMECTKLSFFNSLVHCGQLGLLPDTPLQHIHLIPYKGECNAIPGYRGLIHLALRNKSIRRFSPAVVYAKDKIEVLRGSVQKLTHIQSFEEDSGDWTHVYNVVELASGVSDFWIMSRKQVYMIRARSSSWRAKPNESPWTLAEEAMAIKTVIKKHTNYLDLNPEIAIAKELDDKVEAGESQPVIIDPEDFEFLDTPKEDSPKPTTSTAERVKSALSGAEAAGAGIDNGGGDKGALKPSISAEEEEKRANLILDINKLLAEKSFADKPSADYKSIIRKALGENLKSTSTEELETFKRMLSQLPDKVPARVGKR